MQQEIYKLIETTAAHKTHLSTEGVNSDPGQKSRSLRCLKVPSTTTTAASASSVTCFCGVSASAGVCGTLTPLEGVDAVLMLAGQDHHGPPEVAVPAHLQAPQVLQGPSQAARDCSRTSRALR